MKKIQFYVLAVMLVAVCFMVIVSFVIIFGSVCNLFDTSNIDLGALSTICVVFLFVGNLLAMIVRDLYDDVFEGK